MKPFIAMACAALALATSPAQAASMQGEGLDFHLFEGQLARSGDMAPLAQMLRDALPVGQSAAQAVAMLRRAGAHCARAAGHSATLPCYYRETLGFADTATTYATWDVRLHLAAGKVAGISISRHMAQS